MNITHHIHDLISYSLCADVNTEKHVNQLKAPADVKITPSLDRVAESFAELCVVGSELLGEPGSLELQEL